MTTAMDSTPGFAAASRPSMPGSPTLTNPDMILPDYERSPSPVGLDDSMMHSPLLMWRGQHVDTAPGTAQSDYTAQAQQFHGFSSVSAAVPATPIIYGNGTMLSDIGEVTEAESTPGKPSPPRYRRGGAAPASPGLRTVDSEGDAAGHLTPTTVRGSTAGSVKERAKAAQRERRSSIDSNSTITDDRDQPAVLQDFDDTVSVGDSVFQGDDEESMASSYADDTSLAEGPPLIPPGLSREAGQKYTTAQLSRRAEQILANAKKRLTHMEDNLSRARSSLYVVPTYSGSNSSTPSPPINRASTALILSSPGPSSPASGHHRMGSDNALRIGLPIKVYPQRSSSVLGVATAPRARPHSLNVSKSADQLNGQYNRQRASYIVREALLEPLGEDDVSQPVTHTEVPRYSAITSPTLELPPNRSLSRSASTSQMRDIRDQVEDLKGKISSLREQARADSMRRRSLQSLRTPSPFTHSQIRQWHKSTAGDSKRISDSGPEDFTVTGETTSGDSTPYGESGAPNQVELEEDLPGSPVMLPEGHAELHEDDNRGLGPYEDNPHLDSYEADFDTGIEDDNEDLLTENGDVEEEEERGEVDSVYEEAIDDGYDVVSESGDSIYHESLQNNLSHEDREDAFDYEHFFLHSAMGTISQRMARRGSDASFTSEESVETTRGPMTEEPVSDGNKPPALTRRGSETSISTIETFATAEEGVSSRKASLDLDRTEVEDKRENQDDNYESADQVEQEAFPALYITSNGASVAVEGPPTPLTAKRATFSGTGASPFAASQTEQRNPRSENLYSAARRPFSSTATTRSHAASVSSTASSTGTTRSFPLVNKHSKSGSSGAPTPDGGSSSSEAKTNSSLGIWNGDTTDQGHKTSLSMQSSHSSTSLIEESGTTAVMETLPRDDQFLVERLVASLGRCVLGLTESERASTEAQMYRRRIDAARRILEGMEMV